MGMQEIVINVCYGGFGLSAAGMQRYAEIKGLTLYLELNVVFPTMGPTYWLVPEPERVQPLPGAWSDNSLEDRRAYNDKYESQVIYDRNIDRDDPALVQVVNELGEAAGDKYAKLKVVEVPSDIHWTIEEYDGWERVEEVHHCWE